ncbi:MAG: PIN domain nuclease [Deltaproteobacteria bacterium]|nr:PIN domain nuclease [Deltaproteobacteria bacterium]
MILVDTSVWIEFFNGVETTGVRMLGDLIELEEEVCISDYILTEVLQGFRRDRDFELAQKHLLRFPVYSLNGNGLDSYIKAAQIYRKCRKQGITIRKTVDCMIAQTAIENKLTLLHNDSDFGKIASVCPLKIYQKN